MNYKIIKDNTSIKLSDSLEKSNIIDLKPVKVSKLYGIKKKIKNYCYFLPNIDYAVDDNIRILKRIIKLYDYCNRKNIPFGKKEGNERLLAYIKSDTPIEDLKNIEEFFQVLLIDNKNDMYSYIYDKACDQFDAIFRKNNYCDFKNCSCSCQRNARVSHDKMGCCYEFYYRKFDNMPVYTDECSHLTPTGCDTKCLGCKIFTCRYLKKIGIKFKSDDNFLLRTFLNRKQKDYTDNTYFKTKEEILNEWEKLSHK